MSWPVQWGPVEIWALLTVRRDSYASLGRHIGASGQTVARWVSGGQPPTQKGLLRQLDETLAGLAPWRRDWFDELRVLTASSHDAPRAGLDAETGEEDPVKRAQVLRGGAAIAGLAAAVPVERSLSRVLPSRGAPNVASARAIADGLFSAYATANPADQLDPARAHLSTVLSGLGRVMLPGQRDELRAVGVDLACLCGLLAYMMRQTGDAHAFFALAAKLAKDAGSDALLARALDTESVLYFPTASGDSRAALRLLNRAAALDQPAGILGASRNMGIAENHAALGEREPCLRAMERAVRQLDGPDGYGLLSTQGYFAGWSEWAWTSWRGWCHALLNDADRAFGELPDPDPQGPPRRRVIAWVNTALAHGVAGDPEPAYDAAISAIDESERVGYIGGLEKVRFVVARFDPAWAGRPEMIELSQRLRLPA